MCAGEPLNNKAHRGFGCLNKTKNKGLFLGAFGFQTTSPKATPPQKKKKNANPAPPPKKKKKKDTQKTPQNQKKRKTRRFIPLAPDPRPTASPGLKLRRRWPLAKDARAESRRDEGWGGPCPVFVCVCVCVCPLLGFWWGPCPTS